jgi:PAS domain S-box-containing protein
VPPTDERLLHAPTLSVLRAACGGAALLAVLVGGAILIGGWALGVRWLTGLLPGLSTMKANTALGLVLCGGALWSARPTSGSPRVRRGAVVAASLAVLIGLLTLVEYAGHVSLGVDQLLFRDVISPGTPAYPGRMSPPTALCLVMLGAGIVTLDRPRWFTLGQRLAVAAGFIAFLNVVGYAYSVRVIAGVLALSSQTEMAIHTALCLLALSVGVMAARPGLGATGIFARATAGGEAARVLAPVAIVGPFVIGSVCLAGERAGYYDTTFRLALMVTANILLFSLTVWWTAWHLHRTDVRRRLAEADVRRSNEELEARVRARTAELAASEARYRRLIADSMVGILVHREGHVRFANAAAARLFGHESPDTLVGARVSDLIAPEFRDEVRVRVEARLRGEPVPVVVQLEALTRDGQRAWVEGTASVVEWDGEPSTLVALVDIGERRRREAAERQAVTLRSVAHLANATAHEINNPLTVVIGNLELLRAEVSGLPEASRRIEQCVEASRRISAMIASMQHITRLEMLAMSPDIPALDLRRSSQEPDP